ncbi:MAG: zf-TFIIB domain-containing protein [Acidimicrobiales bacterium]
MICPTDGETLLMSERLGIEIDYCPRCRGVWLDRGELDKMLSAADRQDDDRSGDKDHDRDRGRPSGDPSYSEPKRKKKSFLSELFEGGD